MRNLGRKILAVVLFYAYSHISLGAVEAALTKALGKGSELDTLWMLAALILLPLCGILVAYTMKFLEKFL